MRVHVPDGSELARVATLAEDTGTRRDLDLHVYKDGERIASSRSPGGGESIILRDAGDYDVYVHQTATPLPQTALPFVLRTWVVSPDESAGGASLTPATAAVTAGDLPRITVDWRGLDVRRRYFGIVEYGENTAGDAGRTYLTVTP
jgi:hypothetical protein